MAAAHVRHQLQTWVSNRGLSRALKEGTLGKHATKISLRSSSGSLRMGHDDWEGVNGRRDLVWSSARKSVSMSFRLRFRADIWHAEATADRNTDRWKLRRALVATVEGRDKGKREGYMQRCVNGQPMQTRRCRVRTGHEAGYLCTTNVRGRNRKQTGGKRRIRLRREVGSGGFTEFYAASDRLSSSAYA